MKLQELISLYFERTNAMQTLWGIYITIVLALLAFYGSKDTSAGIGRSVLITMAFVGFAVVNLDALKDVTTTRNRTRDLIVNDKASDHLNDDLRRVLPEIITPPSVLSVMVFHIAGDLMVVGWIWGMTLSKKS